MLGAIDRRAYRAHQIEGGRIPRCLGVLPDLGRARLDPETSVVAAHCVHQIRNHVEALRQPKPGFILAVSSAYQGDGKTNIAMALGWSYATSGHRTLLVDCDFTGQGLSSQMGVRRRPGLREAIRDGKMNGHVAEHRVPNLSVLGAGVDQEIGPEMVRRSSLDGIFEELRRRYEVIIVDTGPMLASLEGLPVVSIADEVLLSVRRGRRRAMLEGCVDRIRSVGSSCIGIVLNYADRSDCNRYASRSSLSLPREPGDDAVVDATEATDRSAVGGKHSALVRAMDASRRGKADDQPPQ